MSCAAIALPLYCLKPDSRVLPAGQLLSCAVTALPSYHGEPDRCTAACHYDRNMMLHNNHQSCAAFMLLC